MFDLNLAKIFSTVVETKSVTKAADILRIPKATVSRKLSVLEETLGVRLLQRTTRKLSITSAGHIYYKRCKEALQAIQEANYEISQQQCEACGEIRITCPVVFADQFLYEPLRLFHQQYPKIHFNVDATNEIVNLVENNIDLAIRCMKSVNLPSSTLVARNLGSTCYVAVASPEYIKQHNKILHPTNFLDDQTLIGHSESWNSSLKFIREDEVVNIKIKPTLNVGTLNAMRAYAIDGMGLTILPCYFALEALRKGQLKILMPEWKFIFGDIFLVYPSRLHIPNRLRLFIDFAVEHYEKSLPWLEGHEELCNFIHDYYPQHDLSLK